MHSETENLPPPSAVKLSTAFETAFRRMLADYETNEPTNMNMLHYRKGGEDFETYVLMMEEQERGDNLPPPLVPCSHRWLVAGQDIVGVVRLRHHIDTPFLSEEGGHIGYDVPPSQRRRGYGTACLKTALGIARTLGIVRVLITCRANNEPSIRTIERCGGLLEVERFSAFRKELIRRYWIEVSG